ncbi:aldose 1-epimerase [Nakamurella sp. UYEF19]|uniref:aldose 1-epimerase family protein n=1 Tax=Nakamurella sp. UYEF19 TaxID=1756392 RepID=UPI003397B71F
MSATVVRPVSGHQFEVRRGDAVVKVGQVAAVLREFSVAGVHFTETWTDDVVAPMGCGLVLAPWPNRVAGGRWQHEGKTQQLDITEPSRGNAIHGLLRNTAYHLVDQGEDFVTLGASIYPQHGYPFTLDLEVIYALVDDGLRVTYRLTNVGVGTAPFGIGAHPYLRVGEHAATDLTVTVAADTHAAVDDRMIPMARESVDGTHLDLRGGIRVGDIKADTALTGLTATDGRVAHRLAAGDGTAVVLWADEVFGWVQIYSPENFPGPGLPDQRVAIAVEPMTCAVDAFNSGDGLLHLAPGETWTASWGLRPEGF